MAMLLDDQLALLRRANVAMADRLDVVASRAASWQRALNEVRALYPYDHLGGDADDLDACVARFVHRICDAIEERALGTWNSH